MADEKFILNVDDDWKRQAQEEKRRLAEQEQRQKQEAAAAVEPPTLPGEVSAEAVAEEEESAFGALVHTLLTQTMIYLGAMGGRSGMPMVNLDAARKSVDMLGAVEEKSRGNLSPHEQAMLDTALYQARNQFVSVASQYIGP